MTARRSAWLSAGFFVLALCILRIGRRHTEPPAADAPSSTSPSTTDVPAPSAAPENVAPPSTPLPLAGPRQTIAAELALLGTDREEAFRSTFLPEIQPQITREAFAACKARVMNRAVRPDWEVAEDRVVNGRRVVRVSIFGKSMTGFVAVGDGDWRADAVWCLPPKP